MSFSWYQKVELCKAYGGSEVCECMHGCVQENMGSSPVQVTGMKLRTTTHSAQIQVCFACDQRLCLYSLGVFTRLVGQGKLPQF